MVLIKLERLLSHIRQMIGFTISSSLQLETVSVCAVFESLLVCVDWFTVSGVETAMFGGFGSGQSLSYTWSHVITSSQNLSVGETSFVMH